MLLQLETFQAQCVNTRNKLPPPHLVAPIALLFARQLLLHIHDLHLPLGKACADLVVVPFQLVLGLLQIPELSSEQLDFLLLFKLRSPTLPVSSLQLLVGLFHPSQLPFSLFERQPLFRSLVEHFLNLVRVSPGLLFLLFNPCLCLSQDRLSLSSLLPVVSSLALYLGPLVLELVSLVAQSLVGLLDSLDLSLAVLVGRQLLRRVATQPR